MHGGTVTAHSDGPGRGAERDGAAAVLAAQPAPGAPSRGGRRGRAACFASPRILVADDNDDAAAVAALQLQLAGHDVRTAHDGARGAGRRRASSSRRSCCSTSACRRWTATRRRARCAAPWGKRATLIALTGWGQQQDRQRTAEAGFDVHLVKPVAELELFEALSFVRPQAGAASQAAQIG